MTALHATFVVWAYGFAALILSALVVWIAADYRVQKKRVTELEAKRAKK